MATFLVKADWAGPHEGGFGKGQIVTTEQIKAVGHDPEHWLSHGGIEEIRPTTAKQVDPEQVDPIQPDIAPRPATQTEIEELEKQNQEPIEINSPSPPTAVPSEPASSQRSSEADEEAQDSAPRRLGGRKR